MVLSLRLGPEDAVDVLCTHHQTIRDLADAVTGEHQDRRRVLDQLYACVLSHEAAEQLLLRPVTRTCVIGGDVVAETRAAEERQTRQRLDELADLDTESGQFLAAFGDFSRQLLGHLDSEERYEFPLVRAYRDEEALVALGNVLRRADPVGPDREPTGASGLAEAVMAPLATAVGKVRGAVAGVIPL
jgi:hemerythrin superfamily protein